MFTIIWEYHIEPSTQPTFEHYYHANGIWAQCFGQHPDFIQTELLQDQNNPYRYLTIDYWHTETSFNQFYQQHHAEYQAIDALCSSLTISENRIGNFVAPVERGATLRAEIGIDSKQEPTA